MPDKAGGGGKAIERFKRDEVPHQFTFTDAQEFITAPGGEDNKYTRGVVQLSTGSKTYPGAGLLSVLGAVGAGATLVRFVSAPDVSSLVLSKVPEVVLRPGWSDASAVGSGYDENMNQTFLGTVASARESQAPVVLDAGAISLVKKASSKDRFVFTPHVGEATELWATFSGLPKAALRARLEEDPAKSAAQLASLTGGIVVLKGSTTYVAEPGTTVFSVSSRSGWAGTAGSGDVLTGVLVAVLASRKAALRKVGEPVGGRDLATATAAGVFLHARAAEVASNVLTPSGKPTGSAGKPITASQIALALPQVVEALLNGE